LDLKIDEVEMVWDSSACGEIPRVITRVDLATCRVFRKYKVRGDDLVKRRVAVLTEF